jgi:hypothetical protein
MKNRILAGVAALLFSGVALSAAYAQQARPDKPHPPMGERTVTKEDFVASHAKHFALLDADKDGKVTPEEMTAFREHQRSVKALARFDANKDGVVDAAEFAGYSERQFIRMDNNDDGVLDRKDMRMAMRDGGRDGKMQGRRGEHHQGDDETGPRWHHRGDAGSMMDGLAEPKAPVAP